MTSDIQERLQSVRKLFPSVRHAAMATVNEDGSPHNTPYQFMYDPGLRYLYWGSHPESQHSSNILRSGQVFVVIYDSFQPKRGGLYIQAEKAHELSGKELKEALSVHNTLRTKEGKQPLPIEYYVGDSAQRMYRADAVKLWINYSERDKDGHVLQDRRYEVKQDQIL